MRPLVALAMLALLVTGCAGEACPEVQRKSNGTYVIASPAPSSDPTGCEYEIGEGGRMESERDSS